MSMSEMFIIFNILRSQNIMCTNVNNWVRILCAKRFLIKKTLESVFDPRSIVIGSSRELS